MQLYFLDDDSVDSALSRMLSGCHDILIPAAAGTAGQEDAIHLMRSIQQIGRS
jgi:hypothetical protein